MFKLLLLLSTALTVNCQTEDKAEIDFDILTHPNITHLQRDVNILAYTENFKNILTEYVNNQYRNLTMNEIEKVKTSIEDFFVQFALDLRRIVNKIDEKEIQLEAIEDGLPDSTFNDIKVRIREEFPDVNEVTAKEIVHALRRNLLYTRQKIDVIIKDSQRSQIENSQN